MNITTLQRSFIVFMPVLTLAMLLNSCSSTDGVASYPEIETQKQTKLLERIKNEAHSVRVTEIIPATATSKRRETSYIATRTEQWSPVIKRWLDVEDWYCMKLHGNAPSTQSQHTVSIELFDANGKSIISLNDTPKRRYGYEWSDRYEKPQKYMHRDLAPLIEGYPRLKAARQ